MEYIGDLPCDIVDNGVDCRDGPQVEVDGSAGRVSETTEAGGAMSDLPDDVAICWERTRTGSDCAL